MLTFLNISDDTEKHLNSSLCPLGISHRLSTEVVGLQLLMRDSTQLNSSRYKRETFPRLKRDVTCIIHNLGTNSPEFNSSTTCAGKVFVHGAAEKPPTF